MKIILISGLSGSGKTIALNLLEDNGFFCIDNLPLELLPELIALHSHQRPANDQLAISIDIRSNLNTHTAHETLIALRRAGHQVSLLFLEASEAVLLRRFSETRRSHPLARNHITLPESLRREREWLAPLREHAYCIDTSSLTAQQLRHLVAQWIGIDHNRLLVSIISFGFKHSAPPHADFVFDVRSLPNPYYDPSLRPYNGKEQPIQDYLAAQPLVNEMIGDIFHFLHRWLPRIRQENRSYVTIAIGCTGGQHRSVYIAEQLGKRLADEYQTLVFHRQLSQ